MAVRSIALSGRCVRHINVDGLDPSVVPASGWPQPGGLHFRDVAGIIGELSRAGRIIGGDVVELLRPEKSTD
jgi:agmatinase